MQSQARAVVIGGGVVGCSILYHLTEAGWHDAVLLERDELTAGSTWHAAGLLPLFNMSYAVGQIHRYSIELYTRLAEEWQRDVGFRRVGNLRMARTRARMEEFQTYASTADAIGIAYEWWSPDGDQAPLPAGQRRRAWSARCFIRPTATSTLPTSRCCSPTRRARVAPRSTARRR